MTQSRRSKPRPTVSMGSPTRTDTVTGQMIGLPFRIAARAPMIAMGTTGACALRAITKPPFLNGSSSPVRLRVPSGKMRNDAPDSRASAARSMAGRL